MGVTSYYSFGGEIIGEETGGVRRDYLTDALGSVTATVTGAGVVENTYRYKPFGEQLAKTGTGSDPKFLWNGKWGYKKTDNYCYVRSRTFTVKNGVWISKDRLHDILMSKNIFNTSFTVKCDYVYCENSPVRYSDPSGFLPTIIPPILLPWVPNPGENNNVGTPLPGYHCSGENALTACNYLTGGMFTILCHSRCDAPCSDAHEGQHRNDRAACCSKFKDCLKSNSLAHCMGLYSSWIRQTRRWSECRAYNSGRDCREKMFRNIGCSWNSTCDSECCKNLKAAIDNDNAQIGSYCRGIDPWGPPPSPCPF